MLDLLLAAALAVTPPAPPAPSACKADRPVQALNSQTLSPRRLGELPPGLLMHAVLITAGSCALVQEREADGFGNAVWRTRTLGEAVKTAAPAQTPGR